MGWKGCCLGFVAATGLLTAGSVATAWLGWQQLSAPVITEPTDIEAVRVEIPAGSSVRQIGTRLFEAEVIRSTLAWEVWLRWQGIDPKAGTFDLDPRWSLVEVAAAIETGVGVQAQFTVLEGWRITQMADYFEALGWFSAEDFIEQTEQIDRDRFAWLPEDLPHLEGWLFPNTYGIPLDSRNPETVVEILLLQFETDALPLYWDYATPLPEEDRLSLQEWVTLASIVEKESVLPENERKLRVSFVIVSSKTFLWGLIRRWSMPLIFGKPPIAA